MKIVIAGCGKVGATICERLSAEGHEIVVIDESAEVVSRISNLYDVMGVVGNAASYEVQKEVGIEEAELLIAVTDSDEINMLCCLIAKKAGNCKTIARVRNPIYHREVGYIREELGLSMAINPEQSAAREISRIIRFPGANNIETFARGLMELIEFEVPENCPIAGHSVAEIRNEMKTDVILCAVDRGTEVIIPNGSLVIEAGDLVNFVAAPKDARKFFKELGLERQKINDVMIVGGSTIAFYLSQILTKTGYQVKIIEQSRSRCEELNEMLPEVEVICGDASNHDILVEEGLERTDAFVSLTGLDEANIFLSLTAQDRNTDCKVITKLNRLAYEDVIGKFNLGSLVYPKYMTAQIIVRYVRALEAGKGSNVETLYRIIRDKAEALEFVIRPGAPVTDMTLLDMPIKKGVLIAAIVRGREILYPNGHSMLQVGDRVVVVTTLLGLNSIEDILET